MSGFLSVEFRCPWCGSDRWGTIGERGRCNGSSLDGLGRCPFSWARYEDFRVFVNTTTGKSFGSALELERIVGMRTAPPGGIRPGAQASFPEVLHELLAELMACPPTPGVIRRWTLHEQRRALMWASHEILGEEDPTIVRFERPPFIEERAATA